jgi:DNA-binding NtrC family response regulator
VLLAPTNLVTVHDLPPRLRELELSPVALVAPVPARPGLGVIPSSASSVGPLLREVMSDEALVDDPPSPFPPPVLPEDGLDLAAAVEAFESSLIRQALDRTGGNRNRAAQVLRINRTTLIEKIKRRLKRVGP